MVIEYLLSLGYQTQDIMLFGRSIGGAIAFEIASHYETCCLILLSPFLSLKKVAEDLYGKVASTLLK
jgi:surfactin synthase thioesterase subunit